MKVEWNKVTWYSKLLALILFVTLPFIGFYLGVRYEELITNNQKLITDNEQAKTDNQRQVIDTSTWKTYRNDKGGFEFMYPGAWGFNSPDTDLVTFYIYLDKNSPTSSKDTVSVFVDRNIGTITRIREKYYAKLPNADRNIAVEIGSDSLKDELLFQKILSTFKFTK